VPYGSSPQLLVACLLSKKSIYYIVCIFAWVSVYGRMCVRGGCGGGRGRGEGGWYWNPRSLKLPAKVRS
jgi:hypothetical protein